MKGCFACCCLNYGEMNTVSPEKQRQVLKVGLMINSYNLFLWEYILINKLIHSHYASIDLVVINKSHKVNRTFSEKVRERWKFLIFNFYNMKDKVSCENLSIYISYY